MRNMYCMVVGCSRVLSAKNFSKLAVLVNKYHSKKLTVYTLSLLVRVYC